MPAAVNYRRFHFRSPPHMHVPLLWWRGAVPDADELSGPFRIITTSVQHLKSAGKWIMQREYTGLTCPFSEYYAWGMDRLVRCS